MARTKIVIVYGQKSKIMRRVNVPDDDSQLPIQMAAIGPGEAAIAVDWTQGTLTDAEAVLEKLIGAPTSSDMCAVVDDKGLVVGFAKADPALDTHPDGVLLTTDAAVAIGDTWDGKQFAKADAAANAADADPIGQP